MFEYLANNTNVEWSQTLVGYSQNEKKYYFNLSQIFI
ncbi:MAG: hypothetical protein J6R17_09295 [Bacteroidales bacterium]|nr:hypothetical protein [Bacteroidales bacterium]